MQKFQYIKFLGYFTLIFIYSLLLNQSFGLNSNVQNSECASNSDFKQQEDRFVFFPESSGSFAVGYKNIELTDLKRIDPYDAEKSRSLKVTFYYPSTASIDHSEPYGEEEEIFWNRELRPIPALEKSFEVIMEQIRTLRLKKSLDSTPLPGKYPLLVFNHGFGITAGSYQSLFLELVSHGYIVCAIHNPYIADTVIFQNDDKLFRKAERDKIAVDTCFEDLTFVLSSLSQIEHFHGLMDMDRIGILGHSLGGTTSMMLARANHLIKAAAQLDAPIEDLSEYEDGSVGFDKPFLHLFADKNSFIKTGLKLNNFKGLVVGAEHNSFADHEVLEQIIPFFQQGEPDLAKYRTIVAIIRTFFDQFLKEDHDVNLESFRNQYILLETIKDTNL